MAAAYASFVFFGALIFGRAAKQLMAQFIGPFTRGAPGKVGIETAGTSTSDNSPSPRGDQGADGGVAYDSGTSHISNNSTLVLGRLSRHAHSAWLFGVSTRAVFRSGGSMGKVEIRTACTSTSDNSPSPRGDQGVDGAWLPIL